MFFSPTAVCQTPAKSGVSLIKGPILQFSVPLLLPTRPLREIVSLECLRARQIRRIAQTRQLHYHLLLQSLRPPCTGPRPRRASALNGDRLKFAPRREGSSPQVSSPTCSTRFPNRSCAGHSSAVLSRAVPIGLLDGSAR